MDANGNGKSAMPKLVEIFSRQRQDSDSEIKKKNPTGGMDVCLL